MVTQMTRHLFSTGSHEGSSVTGLNSSLVACKQAPSLEEQVEQIQLGNLARSAQQGEAFHAPRFAPNFLSSRLLLQAGSLDSSLLVFVRISQLFFCSSRSNIFNKQNRCSGFTPFAELNKGTWPCPLPPPFPVHKLVNPDNSTHNQELRRPSPPKETKSLTFS